MKSVWDAFLYESKSPLFFFNRDFMEYHEDRFEDHSLLFYDGPDLVGLLPATLSGTTLTSHGGLSYGGLILSQRVRFTTVESIFVSLVQYATTQKLDRLIYKAIPYIFHLLPSQAWHPLKPFYQLLSYRADQGQFVNTSRASQGQSG
jgi:hypothetical protein